MDRLVGFWLVSGWGVVLAFVCLLVGWLVYRAGTVDGVDVPGWVGMCGGWCGWSWCIRGRGSM